jgi:hypothetical protein
MIYLPELNMAFYPEAGKRRDLRSNFGNEEDGEESNSRWDS